MIKKVMYSFLVLSLLFFTFCGQQEKGIDYTYTGEMPAEAYEFATNKGYIEGYSWKDAPASVKKAFDETADGNIFKKLDGSEAVDIFKKRIGFEQWELLFPNRNKEYYSYDSFTNALRIIGKYAYLVESTLDAEGKNTATQRTFVLYKNKGKSSAKVHLVSQTDDYFGNEEQLKNAIKSYKVVDYASFGTEGTDNDKIRVIAGFLAQAAHETSDSHAASAPSEFDTSKFEGAFTEDNVSNGYLNGMLSWALYYNEEIAFAGVGTEHYSDKTSKVFPPYPGKSYHGRGSFQLSWNYNYGLASAIFFGDSRLLLQNPNSLIDGLEIPKGFWLQSEKLSGGTMAFLTSLMFWLTPQGPKPSQQDVMILNTTDGKYNENTTDQYGTISQAIAKLPEDKNHGKPGFGWTINIMNGFYESGKSMNPADSNYYPRLARRVIHYKFYSQILGATIDNSEQIDTVGYTNYAY